MDCGLLGVSVDVGLLSACCLLPLIDGLMAGLVLWV